MAPAGGLVGAGLGMLGQNRRAEQQHGRQKELMDIQNSNQRGLNEQGQALQMKTWNETNYGAQMDHMEKAGLNPALMYGMSGGGGSTTGGQGGGSAQGGQAPMQGIEGIMQAQEMGAQIALLASQKKKLDAETRNIEEEGTGRGINNKIEKDAGQQAKTAEMYNRLSEAKAEGKVKYGKWDDGSKGYEWNDKATKAESRGELSVLNKVEIENMERRLAEEEDKVRAETVRARLVNSQIDAMVKSEGISLSEEKRREIDNDIKRKWMEAGFKGLDSIIKGALMKGKK